MDPSYLNYLATYGIEPMKYMEMQANYLRYLASCYSTDGVNQTQS